MIKSQVTRTVKKSKTQNQDCSLGYQRLAALPSRVSLELGMTFYKTTGSMNTHDVFVKLFSELTEEQYVEYLMTEDHLNFLTK